MRKNKPSITEKPSESTSGNVHQTEKFSLDHSAKLDKRERRGKGDGKPIRVTFTASSSSVSESHLKGVVIIPRGSIKLAPPPRTSRALILLSPRQTLVTVSQLNDTNIETLDVTGSIHSEPPRCRKALAVRTTA